MSLIGSLLALVVIPLKAKPPEPKPDRSAEVEAMTFALDHWRNAYAHLWRENERLREQRDALARELDRRLQGRMQAQAPPQAQYHYYSERAFELPRNAEQLGWRNCVPSRSEVLGNSHGLSE